MAITYLLKIAFSSIVVLNKSSRLNFSFSLPYFCVHAVMQVSDCNIAKVLLLSFISNTSSFDREGKSKQRILVTDFFGEGEIMA